MTYTKVQIIEQVSTCDNRLPFCWLRPEILPFSPDLLAHYLKTRVILAVNSEVEPDDASQLLIFDSLVSFTNTYS